MHRDRQQHPVAPRDRGRLVQQSAVRADGPGAVAQHPVIVEVGPDGAAVIGRQVSTHWRRWTAEPSRASDASTRAQAATVASCSAGASRAKL